MADLFKYVQAQNFSLSGSGAIAGATSITLKSLAGIDGTLLTMTDFGSIGFGTLEPGNGTQEEQISFTGIVQNANGTATLTGVSSVLFISPYTATSGLLKTHPGSSIFIITNTSGFYDQLTGKANDETITGLWTFPSGANNPVIGTVYAAPTTDLQIATKKYVDDIAIAGAPKATNTVYGIVKLSVAAVSPTVPIAIGDNDPRIPTALPVVVSQGGTGLATLTAYAILAGGTTATGNLQQLGLGTTTQVLHGNAGGLATWGAVALATDVSGTLPIANGGTGGTSGASNLLFQSGIAVVSSIADTNKDTLITQSIAGGLLGTANAIRFRGFGTWLTSSGGRTLTLRLDYGGSNVASFALIDAGAGAETVNIEFEFIIYANAATNAQKSLAFFRGFTPALTMSSSTGKNYFNAQSALATTAVDSTSAQTLLLSTQLSSASNPPTLTITNYTIEVLR